MVAGEVDPRTLTAGEVMSGELATLLGSVATKVIHLAKVPVTLVK